MAGKRFVVVNRGGTWPIHQEPDAASRAVARAEPGVVARLLECRGPWCRVETTEITGWIRRSDVWGVYPEENVP